MFSVIFFQISKVTHEDTRLTVNSFKKSSQDPEPKTGGKDSYNNANYQQRERITRQKTLNSSGAFSLAHSAGLIKTSSREISPKNLFSPDQTIKSLKLNLGRGITMRKNIKLSGQLLEQKVILTDLQRETERKIEDLR